MRVEVQTEAASSYQIETTPVQVTLYSGNTFRGTTTGAAFVIARPYWCEDLVPSHGRGGGDDSATICDVGGSTVRNGRARRLGSCFAGALRSGQHLEHERGAGRRATRSFSNVRIRATRRSGGTRTGQHRGLRRDVATLSVPAAEPVPDAAASGEPESMVEVAAPEYSQTPPDRNDYRNREHY